MTTSTRSRTKSSSRGSAISDAAAAGSTSRGQLQRLLRVAERRELERELVPFMRAAWPILEPARPFEDNWHHELLAEYLGLAAEGAIKRLVLNIPPRTTKSREVTVLWPCQVWTRRPATSWIFSSYSGGLSVRHSLERRTVLASEWYQQRWGKRVEFAADQNLKTEFQNTARGTMLATSTGGTVLGHGGDIIVVDDPHNPQQVLSETERDGQLRHFDQQLSTRFNDPATGVIVIVMQRLHQLDLTGHVLEQGGWTHVCLPAEAERYERHVFPVSGRVVERQPGDLLWPTRYPRAVLDGQKQTMGTWAYSGQFQQSPTPLGGGIFKRDWWRFYKAAPAQFDQLLQSWDCTFKDTKDTDYVVGQVWGKRAGELFLLDQVRAQMTFTATIAAIRTLTAKWPKATAKLVEDKANGPAVIDTLRREIPGLIAVEPEGGKIVRAQAVSPLVEAGNVYLPDPTIAAWIHDYIEEHAGFPSAAHDDQVDATSQALVRFNATPGQGLREYVKQQAESQPAKKTQVHGKAADAAPPARCPHCGAGANLIRQTGVDPETFLCTQCGKDLSKETS